MTMRWIIPIIALVIAMAGAAMLAMPKSIAVTQETVYELWTDKYVLHMNVFKVEYVHGRHMVWILTENHELVNLGPATKVFLDCEKSWAEENTIYARPDKHGAGTKNYELILHMKK